MVLRRMRICPSRRYWAQPPSAFGIAAWSGLRCASTGVPMTTITCSPVPTMAGSEDAFSRPAARASRNGSAAPGSANGSRPALTVSTAAWLTS